MSRNIATIFYATTVKCATRNMRASQYLGMEGVVSEHSIASMSKPLFDGHDQPKIYCLPGSNVSYTTKLGWDDFEEDVMRSHLKLMQKVGINTVLFTTYGGQKMIKSKRVFQIELEDQIYLFEKLYPDTGMRYVPIISPFSPRIVFPIPFNEDDLESRSNRQYLLDPDSMAAVLSHYIENHISSPAFLRYESKPVFIFFELIRNSLLFYKMNRDHIKQMLEKVRENIFRRYRLDMYLLSTVTSVDHASIAAQVGLDAITNYIFLPDFEGRETNPLQDYLEEVDRRMIDMKKIAEGEIPYYPTASPGWDATGRAEYVDSYEQVIGKYPYSPIVLGETPEKFREMIKYTIDLCSQHDNPLFKAVIACWNETGEGCSVLPRIFDNLVDSSYLDVVQDIFCAKDFSIL